MSMSLRFVGKLSVVLLAAVALCGDGTAQGRAGGAPSRREVQAAFDPPVLPPAVPWGPGDAPPSAGAPRHEARDGAMDSAAVALGEFQWEARDLVIAGRGPDFVLARKYRSRSSETSSLGVGWTHSYDLRVEQDGTDLILHDGWGRRDRFRRQADGTYTSPGWFAVATEQPDGTVQVRLGPFANVWLFASPTSGLPAAGGLTRIEDQHGNGLSFAYDANGDLAQVRDTLGRAIDFAYDRQRRLTSVTDFSGRVVRYSYYGRGEPGGDVGVLKAVTSPAVVGTPTGNDHPHGKTTRYTYTKGFPDTASNHNLLTIRNPDGSLLLRNRYGRGPSPGDQGQDWLVEQWLAPAEHPTSLDYSLLATGLRCLVNDEVGNVREHEFRSGRRQVQVREYAGRADPGVVTTATSNRPKNPLRPGEQWFLTTVRLNADSSVVERRTQGPEDVRVEVFEYEVDRDPTVDATRRGNLVRRAWGDGRSGARLLQESFTYDPVLGVQTSRTRPGGQTTTLVRDPGNGVILQVQHPEPGVVEDFEYNGFGQRTAHVHPDNGNNQRQRDEFDHFTQGPSTGYLMQVRANSAHNTRTTSYTYDAVGHLTSTTDPRGNTTRAFVNALDQVVRIQAPDLLLRGRPVGATTDYYYDENDRCVQVDVENRDEAGVLDANTHWTTRYRYDPRGRLRSQVQEIGPGELAITEALTMGATLVVHRPGFFEGDPFQVETLEWDERGLLFRRTRAPGHPTDQSTTQWDYDLAGDVVRVSEGLEGTPRTQESAYDPYGRPVQSVDAMGNAWTHAYDDNGNRTRALFEGELRDIPGAAGNVRQWEGRWQYDAMDRLVAHQADWFDPSTQQPIGDGQYNFLLEISGVGSAVKRTDDSGAIWTFESDLSQWSTTRTDPMGQSAVFSEGPNGNLVQIVETTIDQRTGLNEQYATTHAYDEWNRLVRTLDPMQNAWQVEYDSRSLPVVLRGPAGGWRSRSYDGSGRLLQERVDLDGNQMGTDPADAVTTHVYDAAGRRVSCTDDNGNTTRYQYDSLDRLVQAIHADGTAWSWTFDPLGNAIQIQDGNGSVLTQQFDQLGRLEKRAIRPGPGVSSDTLREDYAYDGLSRLVLGADEDSALLFAHSSLGSILRETLNGQTTIATHDALGRVESCTYPSGRQVLFTNDALGRVMEVVEASGGEVISTLLYAEDRVVRRDLCNGVRSDFDFDGIANPGADRGVRQLVQELSFVPKGPVLDDLQWSYQADQAVVSHFDGRLLTAHDLTRDQASRVIQWDLTTSSLTNTVRYGLDGIGNRWQVQGGPDAGTYFMDSTTPDPADFQQSQYTNTPFDVRAYDDNGNLVASVDVNRGTRQAEYDYRGRLVEWTDATAGLVHEYAHDVLGRMITRVYDARGAANKVQMRYRQHQLLEEQGATTQTYTYEGEAAHAFERRGGGPDLYYLAGQDHTVHTVVDDQAKVLERYQYDPFGVATVMDGAGSVLPGPQLSHTPLFRGMRWHEEAGMYRSARTFHDPRTGRDLSGAPTSAGDSAVDGADFLLWQRTPIQTGSHSDWIMLESVSSPIYRSASRSPGNAAWSPEYHTSCSTPDAASMTNPSTTGAAQSGTVGSMKWDNVQNKKWSAARPATKNEDREPPYCMFLWGTGHTISPVVIGSFWNGQDVPPPRAPYERYGKLTLKRGVINANDDGDLDLYVVNSPGGDNAADPKEPGVPGVTIYLDLDHNASGGTIGPRCWIVR